MTDSPSHRAAPSSAEPGLLDLLGMVAYGQLRAFERLAEDAAKAPDLPAELNVVRLAAAQIDNYRRIDAQFTDWGTDLVVAMTPFVRAIDDYHSHTTPASWAEGLVKAYVGDGLAADFAAEVAQHANPTIRDAMAAFTSIDVPRDFIPAAVRDAIDANPRLAGRLALWGRRLVGEAMSQAQRLATDRPELADLVAGDTGPSGPEQATGDPAVISQIFARLVQQHSARMAALGL